MTKSDRAHENSLALPNGFRFAAIYPAVSPMLAVSKGSLGTLSTPTANGWTVLQSPFITPLTDSSVPPNRCPSGRTT